jgi:hypothetical protein
MRACADLALRLRQSRASRSERRLARSTSTRRSPSLNDSVSVVAEFRKFLETALDGDARAESTIVEIR